MDCPWIMSVRFDWESCVDLITHLCLYHGSHEYWIPSLAARRRAGEALATNGRRVNGFPIILAVRKYGTPYARWKGWLDGDAWLAVRLAVLTCRLGEWACGGPSVVRPTTSPVVACAVGQREHANKRTNGWSTRISAARELL